MNRQQNEDIQRYQRIENEKYEDQETFNVKYIATHSNSQHAHCVMAINPDYCCKEMKDNFGKGLADYFVGAFYG